MSTEVNVSNTSNDSDNSNSFFNFYFKLRDSAFSLVNLQEKEFFILINGTCTAVIDQGNGLEEFKMEGPTSGLYVANYVWHHFKDFSEGSVLLALSSTNYNPNRSDYIEDYDEYLKVRDEKLAELKA